ncbi:hypothetical protein SESBI_43656 [Sesbania bispinosa]|nr:hypothetical protein SESBI_43656 [Sesbania bispinosa]
MSIQATRQVSKAEEKEEGTEEVIQQEEAHPYAFHVSGPRNLTNLNWRDLINSSWLAPISPLALI